MSEPDSFWDAERVTPSRPITESDISGWERKHGVSLPRNLAAMLVVQNGGCVAGTELFIEPLASITPLSEDQLDAVSEAEDLDFGDGSKMFVFAYDEVGATFALDYTAGPEPRVLSLWFDGAGASGVCADSYDELIAGASKAFD